MQTAQPANTFACPTCGAPLSVTGASDQNQVQCPYCGNTVIVPEALRPQKQSTPIPGAYDYSAIMDDVAKGNTAKMIKDVMSNPMVYGHIQSSSIPAQIYTTQAKRSMNWLGCMIIGIVLFTLVVTLVPIYFAATAVSSVTNSVSNSFGSILGSASDLKNSLTGTQPLLTFGGKGTGAGLLNDARYITVDGKGNIYAGEYDSGRVQKFDSTGKFIKSWIIAGKNSLRAVTADRQGNFYAVRDGVVSKFDGTNSESTATFKTFDFDDMVLLPDGTGRMVGYTSDIDGDLVWVSDKGKEYNRAKNPINSQADTNELDVKIAADGSGNVFALGSFTNAVYKFNSSGKYITRFGSAGNGAGQFQSVQSIAVDGQGRVYVADISGILIFDGSGRYLSTITMPLGTVAFGMGFTPNNDLVVTDRDQVYVFSTAAVSGS